MAMDYMGAFGFVALLWSAAISIFWIVVGLRAVRAHERLAAAMDQIARAQNAPPRRAE